MLEAALIPVNGERGGGNPCHWPLACLLCTLMAARRRTVPLGVGTHCSLISVFLATRRPPAIPCPLDALQTRRVSSSEAGTEQPGGQEAIRNSAGEK